MPKRRGFLDKMKIITPFSYPICETSLDLTESEYEKIETYFKSLVIYSRDENGFGITIGKPESYHRNDDQSTAGGSIDRFILEHEPLKFLKEKLLVQINKYTSEYLKYTNNKFIINTSWFTHSKPGNYAGYHMHTNCMLSAVWYLKVPENSGNIMFDPHNDVRFAPVPTEYNIYNSTSWTITPKKGTLVIFDSRLYHKISPNSSNDERISLACNIMPIGELGDYDSYLKIGDS